MKKRYNKLVAYLLMDFSMCSLFLPVSLVIPSKEIILAGVISIIITILLTLYINSRTPKGERVGTWFRAWWLGFKIALKISLCCTLILIPAMLKWSIDMASCDLPSDWSKGEKFVYDEDGNQYTVMDKNHIRDESGNWHEVIKDYNGYYYIQINGNNIYLR